MIVNIPWTGSNLLWHVLNSQPRKYGIKKFQLIQKRSTYGRSVKKPFQMELRDWLRPSLWALMLFVEIFDCIEMIWHFEFLQVLFIAWIFTITFFRSNKDSRKEPWVHSAPVTSHCPHLSYFAPTEKGDWCPMISWIPPAKCHLRANGCQSQLEVSLRCSLDSPQPQLWALLDSTAGALADVIMQFRALVASLCAPSLVWAWLSWSRHSCDFCLCSLVSLCRAPRLGE